jgi:hypothetical protein
MRALSAAASCAVTDVAPLLAYHDCLLCLLAYPQTRALRDATRRELRRIASVARELFESGAARTRTKLANTGVACTDVTINFGWDIARWLVERFPRRADIDSFGEEGLPPQEVVGEALAAMEFELAAREAPSSNFSPQRMTADGARASPGSSAPSCASRAPTGCGASSGTRCSRSS